MSCYIVAPEVIQYMASYIESSPYMDSAMPEMGRNALVIMLVDETIFSVEYRYKDLIGKSTEKFLDMTRKEYRNECLKTPKLDVQKMGASNLLKLFEEYAYQSCEHEGWDHSWTKEIVDLAIESLRANKEEVK